MRTVLAVLAAFAVTATTVALGVALGAAPAAAGDAWVVKAQKRLNHLRCHAGPPNGEVGRWTRSAVIRFQSRVGMKQSGHLDVRTRKRLYAGDALRCDARPVPAHSGAGRRIVLSQRQNWVWLVGPKGRVVAQGGMVDNPSVLKRGSYVVGSYCGRASRIRHNRDYSGRLWLDNFVRFAPCGIGFHRIPRYRSNGKQIHADWILGTNMASSHGCIRLARGLSSRVWDFTSRRTSVHVV